MCTATGSITITEPSLLTLGASVNNDISCNGANDGSATATAGGGTPAYTYAWDNGETTATAIALSGGTHTITVTDANMCSATAQVTISEPPLLTASATLNTDVSCNGANDGSATATAGGGTPTYTYAWDNGETTATAIALNGGIHVVTITDANMCTETASVSISEPTQLTTTISLNNDVSCNGGNDGSATATAGGGSPAYTFLWSNGITTATANNLTAGPHTVTVTDANMCTATASITILEPSLLIGVANLVSDVSCNGDSDGSAIASAVGGTLPYTYAWDNGETDMTAVNLSGGLHTVTITDAGMCTATASVLIGEPSTLTAVATLLNGVSCNGDSDGSAVASGLGGTLPYSYMWDNGETTVVANGLNGGAHVVTVTDANMCTATASITVTEPSVLTGVTTLLSDVSCNGDSDGSAIASGLGGTMPFTYQWDNGETNATVNNLTPGPHTVTITDAGNCTVTSSVTIGEPAPILASAVLVSDASCNGFSDGSATASGTGGTMPYTYLWDSGETTATATGLSVGNHTVTVSDMNACSATATVLIGEPTGLTALTSLVSDVSCNGFSDGNAISSGLGGTTPYTYLWDNGETNLTAFALDAGTHVVTVTDANGCTATGSVLIGEPMAINGSAIVISDVSCAAGTDGSASASATGGTLPYTYLWDNGETTSLATNLGGGPHVVTITDGNACSTTAGAILSEPAVLTALAILANDVSCAGANDGSGVASGLGGTAPYTYLWDNGETNATAVMLSGGSHIVTVSDANMCTATASINVSEPSMLTANASVNNDVICNGANDGSATASAIGGSMPYTYAWDNGETDATAISLSGGTHTVTITDASNCTGTASVSISEPAVLTANASLNNDVSCPGAGDGSATASATGGTMPYTYAWDNGETDATAVSLDGNTHIVTITDTNGCAETTSVIIAEPGPLVAVITVDNDVSCNGLSDGAASTTVVGGTAAYTYAWDNGETTASVTNLGAGTHGLTVTDANNCTTTASVTISEPILLTAVASLDSDASCNGAADGVATVTGAGGTMPYTYTWDSGSTDATATNLNAGNHDVTITDANGCEGTSFILIGEPSAISVTVDATTPANCTSCDGTADISASGGTPPYTYTWSNGNTSEDPADLCSGGNTVTVTDMNGCEATTTATVGNTSTLVIDNTTINNNVSCNGLSDGSATTSVSGGQVPYTYNWTNGSTTDSATGLLAGNYTVTVTDGDGCIAVDNITITEPDQLVASAVEDVAVDCNGASTGQASVSAVGGTMPYTYNWTGGQTDAVISGIPAGPYDVTVTDANGCSVTASTTVSEPALLTASTTADSGVTCNGLSDGVSTVTGMGGTMPYTYDWDSGSTDATATNLNAGTHGVTVTDANGCSVTASTTVSEPALLTASTTADSGVTCNGLSDGVSTVTGMGGTMPYTYDWDSGSTDATATNLDAGTHIVTITDANNCSETASVLISEPMAINLSIIASTPANCTSCDGTADLDVSGGTMPYTFAWSNGNTNEDPADLCAGLNTVTVTDANGCTATIDENTGNVSTLMIDNANVDANVSCNGLSDGSASVTVSGGQMPYIYAWDNGSTDASATGLGAGTFGITITDPDGCEAISSVTITEPSALTLIPSVLSAASCAGLADGSADVTALGGTMPYTYNWESGETTAIATQLPAGTNGVTVTDANGCTETTQVIITEPSAITVSVDATTPANCTSCDGTASLTVGGGSPPYTYNWSNGNTSEDPADLCSGNNTVTVTDANGCEVTAVAAVSNTSTLQIDNTNIDNHISCNGANDGQATAIVSGGQVPYTYTWSDGQTDATATGLAGGNLGVTVVDSDGCIATDNVVIIDPASLNIVANNLNDASCNGFTDGSAEAVVMGGTIPYTYQWDNGETGAIAVNLGAGTHIVTITDNNGCTETASADIAEPAAISIAIDATTDANCTSCDGTASITVTGGVMPLTYAWSNGNTSEDPDDLCAGNNLVTVTDANGCSATASANVGSISSLVIDNVNIDNNVTCNGFNDGQATVTVSGGQMPYTYNWSTGATDATASNLSPGGHGVTVTDADGCVIADNVIISEPTLLTAGPTLIADVSCNGDSDGSASANAAGGTMPYTYAWDNGETNDVAVNLSQGVHTVTITDANSCEATGMVTISEPTAINVVVNSTTDANCTSCDGTADISVSGGTAPYTFAWLNGNTNEDPTDLCSGGNSVIVTDANGCTATANAIVGNTSSLTISSTDVDNDVSCFGFSDGQATATVTGGQVPYTYLWENGQTDATATGLGGGNFGVTVTDFDGCIAVDNVTITEPALLMANVNLVSDITCAFGTDGSAEVVASGGVMPYTYLWATGETDAIATMLADGVNAVTVTDANGCTTNNSIILTEPSSVASVFTSTPSSCFNNDGTATIIASGGTMPYTYVWDNGQTDATATGLSNGSQ
ncbi:MAG: hypothetical protein AAF502_09985, partial [Bacteroidota bacterium]